MVLFIATVSTVQIRTWVRWRSSSKHPLLGPTKKCYFLGVLIPFGSTLPYYHISPWSFINPSYGNGKMQWKPAQGPISEEIAPFDLAAIPMSYGSYTNPEKTALHSDWSNLTPRDLMWLIYPGSEDLGQRISLYSTAGKLLFCYVFVRDVKQAMLGKYPLAK